MESMSRSSFAGDDVADDEWLFFLSLAGAFNSISCFHWNTTGKDIEREKFNLFELVMDFYVKLISPNPSDVLTPLVPLTTLSSITRKAIKEMRKGKVNKKRIAWSFLLSS